jgi:hypothetical protein
MWARPEEGVESRTAVLWRWGWAPPREVGRLMERTWRAACCCCFEEEDLAGLRGKEMERPKLGAIIATTDSDDARSVSSRVSTSLLAC